MVAGISLEGHARKGRFPGLVNCLKTRCRPAGVGHDSATCQIEEINGSSKLIGLRRLPAPLAGRNHRHDRIVASSGLRHALMDWTTDSSGSQNLFFNPLTWI